MGLNIMVALESLRIGGLQVFTARWLHLDDAPVLRAETNWIRGSSLAIVGTRDPWRVHC